ncbi:phosphoribosylanthranilate isomerase [Oricola cellulosilytica]|uniref:N-(5'-phosphoribosyl)anthranilate isomerase n=1 Tax=Oricola cellulosilytica TaxID=1429082 RepID=A0A4R0PGK2_9HYPH|nr:phosphoribosylanthranilate isomerase [Oricola cellulosilytica]TCD16033.1 phosphoribosylanthranilate isomerase [Oricola cellulosilytica]
MTLDIKICGLKTEEALDAALSGGATHVGFIFFEKSPRNVDADTAAALAAKARQKLAVPVVVTVDADDAALAEIIATVQPGMLQLHGDEPPERVADVRAKFGLPVMKALAIRDAADLEKIVPYRGIADRFLFDAKAPAGSELPGGNGISFDWRLLDAVDRDVDYMLSGGLDPENVAEAVVISGARALDVSSGVESAPGVKDKGRITAFLRAARAADPQNREIEHEQAG